MTKFIIKQNNSHQYDGGGSYATGPCIATRNILIQNTQRAPAMQSKMQIGLVSQPDAILLIVGVLPITWLKDVSESGVRGATVICGRCSHVRLRVLYVICHIV